MQWTVTQTPYSCFQGRNHPALTGQFIGTDLFWSLKCPLEELYLCFLHVCSSFFIFPALKNCYIVTTNSQNRNKGLWVSLNHDNCSGSNSLYNPAVTACSSTLFFILQVSCVQSPVHVHKSYFSGEKTTTLLEGLLAE